MLQFRSSATIRFLAGLAALPIIGGAPASQRPAAPSIAGQAKHADASSAAGVLILARHLDGGTRYATLTAGNGSFALSNAPDGRYAVSAALVPSDTVSVSVAAGRPARADVTIRSAEPNAAMSSAHWLGRLSDGETKRKFILDCSGCHQITDRQTLKDGRPRTAAEWEADIKRMLGFAGASTGFPVIAADRHAAETAAWVTRTASIVPNAALATVTFDSSVASITEYDMPMPNDLPHDVAIDSSGSVVITGMFSHTMYVLDPGSGRMSDVPLPVPNGGPRAVEVDARGHWWVLLGAGRQIGRYDTFLRQWRTWPIDMYPHSIGITGDRVWFNGHFTKDPELIAELEPATGTITKHELPPHPVLRTAGGPVPYELRLAPDGRVWMSELQGNRMIAFDPRTKESRVYDMPVTWSGPRRFDIAPDGVLWIPAYSSNQLIRLDPTTGLTKAYALPQADAVPYVVRIDHVTRQVWIGTSAGDALIRFDPDNERFYVYPLPSRGALVRHMTIDPRNHDVWLAYGASPATIPARIARVRLR
ncbi:MAG: hypothetical protein AB1762_04390 [Gemmatimonadota bacterium]